MEPVIDSFEIAHLRLENIRGFRELDLDLRETDGSARRRTLIIGKNGTCKTTILRAIAIGLADQTDGSKLISEPIGGLISKGKDVGRIVTKLTAEGDCHPSVTTSLKRIGTKEEIYQDLNLLYPPSIFVCGYGAGRFGTGQDTGREYRIADSVATLFNYQTPLISTELTLHRLRSLFGTAHYERILQGIKRVLGLSPDHEIELSPGGGVVIQGPPLWDRIPLEAWADGYRLTFNWLLDLYAWAMRAGTIDEQGHVTGILLIDEIDQHLHPSMQAEILPRLSEILPEMQIFATTHSPLVALDARPDELIVLRSEGDQIVAESNVPNFLGYSVEDMLADPRLFDSEVYGQETRKKLEEYRELASIPRGERGPAERGQLRSLAVEIGSFEGAPKPENETSRLLKELMAKYNL